MAITRRDFLKYCGLSAAALGLSSLDLFRLEEALANPTAPKVIWLQGSGCTGCSMSFLNFINTAVGADPTDTADILLNHIDLIYHPNLMFAAGQDAAALANQAYSPNGYVLAVEGGIPTAMGGRTCCAWNYERRRRHLSGGGDRTFCQGRQDSQHRHLRLLWRHPRCRPQPHRGKRRQRSVHRQYRHHQ